jgi:DNA-binding CsgD family transcriptional regulator
VNGQALSSVRAAAPVWRELDPSAIEGLEHLVRPCGCPRFELTDREIDVLEQIAWGRSTRSAARALFVSHQAVTYHVGNLLAKFQCSNRTGLVARAFVLGVLARTWPPSILPGGRPGALAPIAGLCTHRVRDSSRRRTHG